MGWKNYVAKARRRIASAQYSRKIASWRSKRRRLSEASSIRRSLACLSPLAQLLGQSLMTLLGFGRGKLHSEVEEPIFIAFCVALDKSDKLLGRRHVWNPGNSRR